MAFTEYQLPTIYNNAVGTVNVYLYHDSSITGGSDIVYPTKVSFKITGEFIESLDQQEGVTELETVTLEIIEDYTNHAEGFWHRLVFGYFDYEVHLKFTVMEGATETFLFRGKILKDKFVEGEAYISGTTRVRTIECELLTALSAITEVTIGDLITEILTHTTTGDAYKFVSLGEIVQCMFKLAFGTALISDIALSYSGNLAIHLVKASGDLVYWPNAYVIVYQTDGGWVLSRFFGVAYSGTYWGTRYTTAFDLFKMICNTFAVIPWYSWTDSKHTINFRSRQEFIEYTMDGGILKSDFQAMTLAKRRKVRVTDTAPEDGTQLSYWYYRGGMESGTPPPSAQFDIDVPIDFKVNNDATAGTYAISLHTDVGGGSDGEKLKAIKYWDFYTDAYITLNDNDASNKLAQGLVKHLFSRFDGAWTQFRHTYDHIASTRSGVSSIGNTRLLMSVTINDGVVDRTYCATKTQKNIFTNQVSIIWSEINT